jgi:hypothetical protein
MSYFLETEKWVLKFIWKYKRSQIAKVMLSKMLELSRYQTSNYTTEP